jgi:thiol:disulfide interchange protein DsbD
LRTPALFACAFLGGVFLNALPCVLPLLARRAFTDLAHASAASRRQRLRGLADAAGTVSALAGCGAVVVGFRHVGKLLGWRMQLQHPAFVATIATIVFVCGLNALGVFEITFGMKQKEQEGLLGSVANGWRTTLLGMPGSAPFLGATAALAIAEKTPDWKTFALFTLVGAGLAFPFTLLSFRPGLAQWLPRPGAWMETVRMLLGFPLLWTVVWLYRVLLREVPPDSAALFLGMLVLVAVGAWMIHRFAHPGVSTSRRWGIRTGVVLVLGAVWVGLPLERPGAELCQAADHIHWIPFTPQRVEFELASGKAVFLDFTADWCTSCQANEKLVLETPAVREALAKTGVVPIRVDMTDSDETSDAWRAKVGRGRAVPAYAMLQGKSIELLPVVVNVNTVVATLQRYAQK